MGNTNSEIETPEEREKNLWNFIEECAKEVDSWEDWKKAEVYPERYRERYDKNYNKNSNLL